MTTNRTHFLIGTRWFGILGPCREIIKSLNREGYDVYVFGQKDEHFQRYDDGLAKLVEIRMARSYFTFFNDFLDIMSLLYHVLKLKPDGVHSFNPKPALLSWAAVSVRPSTKFFVGVTGLGNTFIRAKSMEPLITFLLRLACRRASFVFFQNRDDIELFEQKEIVEPEKRCMFISPGVNLMDFSFDESAATMRVAGKSAADAKLVVTCTARLIWQKGIREFVEAARIVKQQYDKIREVEFRLIGELDWQHPDCVSESFIEEAVRNGTITHIPWTDDVAAELAETDIFVLHSYREGAPRAILEASAMYLPTIGADAIGVRELVKDGETGFLTPLREVEPIASAVVNLIDNPSKRLEMGKAARRLIAEPFSLAKASDAQMQMYRNVGYHLDHIE